MGFSHSPKGAHFVGFHDTEKKFWKIFETDDNFKKKTEGGDKHPHRTSWSPDGERCLGTLLS